MQGRSCLTYSLPLQTHLPPITGTTQDIVLETDESGSYSSVRA